MSARDHVVDPSDDAHALALGWIASCGREERADVDVITRVLPGPDARAALVLRRYTALGESWWCGYAVLDHDPAPDVEDFAFAVSGAPCHGGVTLDQRFGSGRVLGFDTAHLGDTIEDFTPEQIKRDAFALAQWLLSDRSSARFELAPPPVVCESVRAIVDATVRFAANPQARADALRALYPQRADVVDLGDRGVVVTLPCGDADCIDAEATGSLASLDQSLPWQSSWDSLGGVAS